MCNVVSSYGDIEIDKSPNGRFWCLLCGGSDDVVLRLRVAHFFAEYECDTFLAEVKVASPDDRGAPSDDGFRVVGQFNLSLYEVTDVGFEEMKRKPDEYSLDGFPEVWCEEFENLVCHWYRLLRVMEFGLAMGNVTPEAVSPDDPRLAE